MLAHTEDTKVDNDLALDSIDDAIAAIRRGEVIIVVDDEDRENEGDFVCAAESVTPEIINFMATHGRGLICTPITEETATHLKLNRMVAKNTDLHETAFTVSVDYKKKGCTTGISAYDRATGIQAILDSETVAEDYARPGHIFPLIARPGGVLRRTGHTEAAVDLAQLAGYKPAGVLVEILNPDGTMARLPQLVEIAKKFDLKLISIKDLVAYRMTRERLVKRESSMMVDTMHGEFRLTVFSEMNTGKAHMALTLGEWTQDDEVLTRVHSATNIADIFSFFLKDTNQVLHQTLNKIQEEGKGALIMLRQDESADDMINIIKTLQDQKEKQERYNPFFKQNMENEQKDFGIGAQIIHDLNIRKIKLLTNKPRKRIGLIGYDLEIVDNIPLY